MERTIHNQLVEKPVVNQIVEKPVVFGLRYLEEISTELREIVGCLSTIGGPSTCPVGSGCTDDYDTD